MHLLIKCTVEEKTKEHRFYRRKRENLRGRLKPQYEVFLET